MLTPGGIQSSVFSLIIICLGAGTITIPYVFYVNGALLGALFIIVGAAVSFYTGFLIAFCASHTGGASYEEIAKRLYGRDMMRFTSICNITCNVGFLISYIVLFKSTMPIALKNLKINLPDWLDDNEVGRTNWASIFCFSMLLPISVPRKLNSLRFTSFLSFGVSIFIIAIIFMSSFNEMKNEEKGEHGFLERIE